MNSKEWKKWLFWFSFAVASIAVYKTVDSVSVIFTEFKNFLDILMPFILAVLGAYILYIPCRGTEKVLKKSKIKFLAKHSRGISIFLVYVLVTLFIFLTINLIIPTVSGSISDLANNIPNYYNSAMEFIANQDKDSLLSKLNVKEYLSNIPNLKIEEEIVKWVNYENVLTYIKGILGTTSLIFDAFVTIVVSVYLLLERSEIKEFLAKVANAFFDSKTNKSIEKYYNKTNHIFFAYITSQVFDAFIVGIIISLVMTWMGVKYAPLLGFIIGLFNVIPYFGAIVAVIIAIVITIFTGGIGQALWLGIIITVLQQIDANIINPRILGTSLNLSPILVIFSVTIGGAYFGVLGMFLGVPVTAFLKIIIEEFLDAKIAKKNA